MPYVTTEWDYDLKTEVFKINGDKGYTHETDTILNEITHETSGETPPYRDTSRLAYFTADFTVDVIRDLSNSQVAFYDNGQSIPVYIGEDKYMTIPWGLNTQQTTVTIPLGYDVEHKIHAKYLGNKKALPSKSKTINLYEPMPPLYTTKLERTSTQTQFEKDTSFLVPIKLTTGTTFETSQTKEVTLYDGEETIQTIEITIPANTTYGTGSFNVSGGLDAGLHHLVAKFEGDTYSEQATLKFDISVGYEVIVTGHSPIFSVTNESIANYTPPIEYSRSNYVDVEVKTFLGIPKEEGARVGVHDDGTLLGYSTVNSQGKARIRLVQNPTTGTFTASTLIFSSMKTYYAEPFTAPVIKVNAITMNPATITAENYTSLSEATITNYEWIANPQTNLSNIPIVYYNYEYASDAETVVNPIATYAYTDDRGVATIPYTGVGAGVTRIYYKIGYVVQGNFQITDVTQYWSATSPSINKEYTHIVDGKMLEVSSGFKFQSVVGTGLSWVGVGDGGDYENDWGVVYDVVSAGTNLQLLAANWKYVNGVPKRTSLALTKPVNLRKGQKITIRYEKSTKTITIKTPTNTTTKQMEWHGYPAFGMKSTTKAQMIVNNVKFRRW